MALLKFIALALAATQSISLVQADTPDSSSEKCINHCGDSNSKCYAECMGFLTPRNLANMTDGAFSISTYVTTVEVSTGTTNINEPMTVIQLYYPQKLDSSTKVSTTTTTSQGSSTITLFSTDGTSLIPTATSTILESAKVTMETALATHPVSGGNSVTTGGLSVLSILFGGWVALFRL